jgi:uncharacterized surface protein with fasciclin (FAS1) repeats
MKKNIFYLFPILFLFLVSSCGSEDEPMPEPMTIVETAQATADLSLLVEAVVAADLVDALNSGTFTVFAPNNAAFQALLDSDPAWNTITDIPVDVLTSVLLFHVVEGEVRAADLSDTYVNTLSTGPNMEPLSLQITTTGGVAFDGDAAPLTTDVETSNGVVHIIDKVMLPNALTDFALSNPDFSALVGALADPRFNGAYLGALTTPGAVYTVFAPNNAAFQALLDLDPTWNSTADIPAATLEAVLNYHVVAGANVQSDQLSDGQVVTMLGSGDVTVDLSNGAALVTGSGQTVNIILTDVQGTNGVIHVVEEVLLPQP